MASQFLFTVCQVGAEAALKQEVARRQPSLRFAFSRAGFVTFRLPDAVSSDGGFGLTSVFARTWGWSLGKARGPGAEQLARAFWTTLDQHFSPSRLAEFRHLHVWPRERVLPGDVDFGSDAIEPARTAGRLILQHWPHPETRLELALNEDAAPGEQIVDCVLVEPNEWWLGWHRAGAVETRWPGGVPSIVPPPNMLSRAYLKLAEALLWSELPIARGDRCLEVGSAPGGACQLLLERGCQVLGVDPAEMDPLVLANPHFTHLRAHAKDLKRSLFKDCRWLMADANVAPKYTLDTVEAIVTHRGTRFEGLLLTLKLTDPRLVAQLPAFHKRIRSWGFQHVRARQLAYNRQEVCVAASAREGVLS